ncbi:hypothetical protein ACRN9V_14845 [Shewanella baltica]|uniref:GAP1-N1 domain-containing protein n=1 Tax=Shewanella baltica TaxID=62322 RepID=UPI003D79EE67
MKKVTIHHTLHGYLNGHRLLATSSELNSDFKHELLKMSDSPGTDFHSGENICYTGYPDESQGFYILSKTWRAKDSLRPGCVWTHSLLIPFSVFFEFEDFSFVMSLFLDEFSIGNIDLEFEPIDINVFEKKHLDVHENIEIAFSYVFSSNEQAVLNFEVFTFDDLITMWMKLWPNMRQAIKFRTWSPKIISNDSYYRSYDILFGQKSNFNIATVSNWASSLFGKESAKCEEFLWRHGEKLERKMSVVKLLVISYDLLRHKNFDELSLLILKWKKAPISLVKEICSLLSADELSKPVVYLISSYILTLGKSDISGSVLNSVGEYLLKNDKDLFYKILSSQSEHLRDISISVICDMPIEIVAELYNKGVYYNRDVLKESIIRDSIFWSNLDVPSLLLVDLLSHRTLSHFLPINDFSASPVLTTQQSELFSVLIGSFNDLNTDWLNYIVRNQNDFIHYLTKHQLENSSISFFVFSKFSLKTLSTLDDDALCISYDCVQKSNLIIYKVLLILIDYPFNNYSNLLCKSFDDICYFLSSKQLRTSEETDIIQKLIKFGSKNYFIFNKVKYHFLYFALEYSERYDFSLDDLTCYKENLRLLERVKYKLKSDNDFSWF